MVGKMKMTGLVIILVGVVVTIIIFIAQPPAGPSPSPSSSIQLISYECNVKVIDWEHEYAEANITILNSGNGDAEFKLEIDLYDDGEYFGFCKLWPIELAAGTEETFTRSVMYELLINHHHANEIEIICGIYSEDDCLQEQYFREFSTIPPID